MKQTREDMQARFDVEPALSDPDSDWFKCDTVRISAIEKPDGHRRFILPHPVNIGRPLGELLRIDASATLPVPELVKLLRNIAKDLSFAHRCELEYEQEKERRNKVTSIDHGFTQKRPS
jgi:hypothetical protein